MQSHGLSAIFLVLVLFADNSIGEPTAIYNPLLHKIVHIGHNYVSRIAEAMLTSAKSAVSNCAGATAEVASQVADHTYNIFRWKRSADGDFDSAQNAIRKMSGKTMLKTKIHVIFADCITTVRQGFKAANCELISAVLSLAIRTTPVVKKLTDTFLQQVTILSNEFGVGIEDCIREAERSAETNINNFASTVARVPHTVSEDLTKIENCYGCTMGHHQGLTDPYLSCACGAVCNMISRVKNEVVNVGLKLPSTALGFTNIGCKLSMCVTDKLYAAKSRITTLALELGQICNGDLHGKENDDNRNCLVT